MTMQSMQQADVSQAYDVYSRLLAAGLSYLQAFVKPGSPQSLAGDLYRAMLRIMLTLHHDFPEFLVENHFRLCNSIPASCTQLFNLVLSGFPSTLPELPSPFMSGLKIDRLEELRRHPRVAADYLTLLRSTNLLEPVESASLDNTSVNDVVGRIQDAIAANCATGSGGDGALIHAIVLHVGQSFVSASSNRAYPLTPTSSAATFLLALTKELSIPARVQVIHAIVNQLRYPNSHTYFFSNALLNIFKASAESADSPKFDITQVIARILIERLYVVKPHPWGLVSTMLELLKNSDHHFWAQSFVKDLPAVGTIFGKPLIQNYWE